MSDDLAPRHGVLVEAVLGLGEELRSRGILVGPGRIEAAVRAMSLWEQRNGVETYWSLRCTLISRKEDLPAFDEAFRATWSGSPEAEGEPEGEPQLPSSVNVSGPARAPHRTAHQSETGADLAIEGRGPAEPGAAADPDDGWREPGPDSDGIGARASALERLRTLDFREWTPDDFRAARPYMQRIARALPRRRTRRRRFSHAGAEIDLRRTVKFSMRTGGHPIELARLRRRTAPRRVLLLLDISGSMEAYARPLVMFSQAVRQASNRAEAFAFGTRFTRITPELSERDPEKAMRRVASRVPDWAGGTRIGENLRVLNASWGRRGVVHGAIVIICSDGWERGDVDVLGTEMERLHRAARTVIWLNPLAGEPDYEPLAAGMAAAIPHVDRLLPGQDLASLERLVEVVEGLEVVGRRSGPPAPPSGPRRGIWGNRISPHGRPTRTNP